jgi:hypothetical protein
MTDGHHFVVFACPVPFNRPTEAQSECIRIQQCLLGSFLIFKGWLGCHIVNGPKTHEVSLHLASIESERPLRVSVLHRRPTCTYIATVQTSVSVKWPSALTPKQIKITCNCRALP